MRFMLEFSCDDDCFMGSEGKTEIARVIRAAAGHVEEGYLQNAAKDINGNTVGNFVLDGITISSHADKR